ncbi:hypothetical protein GCM10020219_005030 [Nonomuraea dietziae]
MWVGGVAGSFMLQRRCPVYWRDLGFWAKNSTFRTTPFGRLAPYLRNFGGTPGHVRSARREAPTTMPDSWFPQSPPLPSVTDVRAV